MVNQNPTYYDRTVISNNNTVFNFDDLNNYTRFINDVVANANASSNARQIFNRYADPNYAQRIIDRYGDSKFGTTDASLVTENIGSYLFNSELQNYIDRFRSTSVKPDTINIEQKKVLKFTEMEIGIFSFDLASLGLIPVVEFYSPILNRVVSGNLIVSEKNDKGETLFYHIFTPFIPKHEVLWNISKNGYYSDILKRVVEKEELIEENGTMYFPETEEVQRHLVERKQKVDENGKKKYSTTWRKSFIHIPKIINPIPRLDIIINSSFSYDVNARTEMIYASMSAITIAEKLAQSGVDFRIIGSYPVATNGSGTSKNVFCFVTLKKEGQPFDKNKIATLLSDGRQFRYQQFKGFGATQYDAGYDNNINVTGIGRPINDATLVKNAYLDYLRKSSNPVDIQSAELPNSKFVFAGALSEQQAQQQFDNFMQQIQTI
jgi:hypothetical protein